MPPAASDHGSDPSGFCPAEPVGTVGHDPLGQRDRLDPTAQQVGRVARDRREALRLDSVAAPRTHEEPHCGQRPAKGQRRPPRRLASPPLGAERPPGVGDRPLAPAAHGAPRRDPLRRQEEPAREGALALVAERRSRVDRQQAQRRRLVRVELAPRAPRRGLEHRADAAAPHLRRLLADVARLGRAAAPLAQHAQPVREARVRGAQPPELGRLAKLARQEAHVLERLPLPDPADEDRRPPRALAARLGHLGRAAPVRQAARAVEAQRALARAVRHAQHRRVRAPLLEEPRLHAEAPVADRVPRLPEPILLALEQPRPQREGSAPAGLLRDASQRGRHARHRKPLAHPRQRRDQMGAPRVADGVEAGRQRAHDSAARDGPRGEAGAQRERARAADERVRGLAQPAEPDGALSPPLEGRARRLVPRELVQRVGATLHRPRGEGAPQRLQRREERRLDCRRRPAVGHESAEAPLDACARRVLDRPAGEHLRRHQHVLVNLPDAEEAAEDVPLQRTHDGGDLGLLGQLRVRGDAPEQHAAALPAEEGAGTPRHHPLEM